MNKPLELVLHTLSLIEVKGRQNVSLLLQATLLVEAGGYADAVKCLDQLTVSGKSNLDMVLGCIIELDKLTNPEEEEVKSDG